jgi:hypothetical protein
MPSEGWEYRPADDACRPRFAFPDIGATLFAVLRFRRPLPRRSDGKDDGLLLASSEECSLLLELLSSWPLQLQLELQWLGDSWPLLVAV